MLSLVLAGLFAVAQSIPVLPVGVPMNPTARSEDASNLTRDLKTLQLFAKTVDGPSDIIANWTKSGDNVCVWDGVTCEIDPKTGKRVLVGISFREEFVGNNLRLDGLLDKLPDLMAFHASLNSFTGTVPDLSQNKALIEIDLSINKLSGEFPKNLYSAPSLTYLDLRFNKFTGELPGKVFSTFKSIESLFLNNNEFQGKLPSTIGQFSGKYLVLANNKFDGAIPSSLGDAKSIKEVLFLGNKLSGSLPIGLGRLANMVVFDASKNQLTGTVPEDLCSIKTLEILNVKDNKMEKTLGPKCTQAKKAGILTM